MFKTLIVEDNKIFRQALKRILGSRFPHMIVEEAANGEKALEKVQSLRPHLIFIDIQLPKISGLELTKQVKRRWADVIIIILTNYDFPEYKQAAYEYGANHFISKGSSTWNEILALVESSLSRLGFGLDGQKGEKN